MDLVGEPKPSQERQKPPQPATGELVIDGAASVRAGDLYSWIKINVPNPEAYPDHALPPPGFLRGETLIISTKNVDVYDSTGTKVPPVSEHPWLIVEKSPAAKGGIGATFIGWDLMRRIPIMLKINHVMDGDDEQLLLAEARSVMKAQRAPLSSWSFAGAKNQAVPSITIQPSPERLHDYIEGKKHLPKVFAAFHSTAGGTTQFGMVMRYLPDEEHANILNSESHWKTHYDQENKYRLKGLHQERHPFLPHQELKELITVPQFISLDRLEKILREVAAAIDWLHRRGIQHLDLKPGNILIDLHDFVTLVDLGKANTTVGDFRLSTYEITGVHYASLFYAAPENFEAQGRLAAEREKADLFALGIIAFELLYKVKLFQFFFRKGRRKITTQSVNQIDGKTCHFGLDYEADARYQWLFSSDQHQFGPEVDASPIPKNIGSVFAAVFARDPNRRPATAALFVQRLIEAIQLDLQVAPELLTDQARDLVYNEFQYHPDEDNQPTV